MLNSQIAEAQQAPANLHLNGPSAAGVLAVAVFTACILGIWTRPIGLLATFWPANALMVGILLRLPASRSISGWIAGALAFLAADLLTGSSLQKAVLLNGANLASIAAAFLVLRRLPTSVLLLRNQASIPYLLLGSLAGGIAAGFGGMIANPILFGGSAKAGWEFWCVTELANFVTVLPLILGAPAPFANDLPFRRPTLREFSPFAALCLSGLAGVVIGGPGAIVFVVPALLWCGLTYSVFVTALLTTVSGYWIMSQLVMVYLPSTDQGTDSFSLVSYRLGVSLLALSPVMQAVLSAARRSAFAGLETVANLDPLTHIANRRAFMARAEELLSGATGNVLVLMMDIDHFKRINDNFGHAAGDAVLIEFVHRVKRCLRSCDLFGRLGGEEFALVIPDCSMRQGCMIAERIRQVISSEAMLLADGRYLPITVSIGMAALRGDRITIHELLQQADQALYAAKDAGRNRIELFNLEQTRDC